MSRTTTAAYDSANDAAHIDEVLFAELQFASGTSYVCTREHDVLWNGITWAGKGQVGTIEAIQEAGDLEPLGVAMTLKVSSELLALALDPSEYKNRTCKIWRGLIGPDMVDLDWAGDPDGATALFEGMGGTITRSGATATRVNEQGLIETVAADTLRIDYDSVTLECKGRLHEEARTNLWLRSAEFDNASWSKNGVTVSADAVTAPDGTQSADSVSPNGGVNSYVTQAAAATLGVTYAFSVYAKAGTGSKITFEFHSASWTGGAARFNLVNGTVESGTGTITPVGDGWYRCEASRAAAATGSLGMAIFVADTFPQGAAGANVYLWGAQRETGAFHTSYIPTTSAAVTRNGESLTFADISDFHNGEEGTILLEATLHAAEQTDFRRLVALTDGTSNERIDLELGTSGQSRLQVNDGGVSQVGAQNGSTIAGDTVFRAAAAYRSNDFAVSQDGTAVTTDTAGTLPTVSRLNVMTSDSGSGAQLCGHERRLTLYPHRLGNDALEALSAGELDPAAAARGRKIVADPVGPFTFRMDSLEFELGRTGTLRLTAEGRLADWQRPRVRYYNDADQQAEYPGDEFFKDTEKFVEAVLLW